MKKVLIGIFALGLISCGDSSTEETAEAGNACKPQTEIQFATIEDEVSYAIGFTNAEELKGFLKQPGFEKVIDLSEYLKGYAAVLNKEQGIMTEEAATDIIRQYFPAQGQIDSSRVSPKEVSYSLGIQTAHMTIRGLESKGVWEKFKPANVVIGFEDALCEHAPQIPQQEIAMKVMEYMSRLTEIKGEQFLAENGKREEVKTTASGLQYEILEEGKGPNPTEKNTAVVNYKGMLIDSTVFDQNDPTKPFEFSLAGGVIMGWLEGVKLMNKGAKYRFYIPHNLAYGAQGTPGGPIPPYSTLIFDVELLDFK